MAGEMVLIACKAPNGLILNLDRYEIVNKENNSVRRIGGKAQVTLRGWSVPMGQVTLAPEQGGYVLTEVPQDFWDAWFALNAESSLIQDRIILPPAKNAVAQAREHRDVPQMFAQALPSGDPRLPKADQDRLAPDRAAA